MPARQMPRDRLSPYSMTWEAHSRGKAGTARPSNLEAGSTPQGHRPRRRPQALMPTTIASGPASACTRVLAKPAWRIHPAHSSPV